MRRFVRLSIALNRNAIIGRKQLTQREDRRDITLDDLLELVESAARTIERLQAANAVLARQMQACESAADAVASDAESKARQIAELEQSQAALRRDAEWCRWFRNKYGASTFYSHIEREFQNERREDAQPGDAADTGSAAAMPARPVPPSDIAPKA